MAPDSRSSDPRSRSHSSESDVESRLSESRSSLKRIERDGFAAEIRTSLSRSLGGEIYHYIIQRAGSREIVHWGQEVSLQRAMECVDEYITDQKRISAVS